MPTRKTIRRTSSPKRSTAQRATTKPATSEAPSGRFSTHEVDSKRWPDFARLFESQGGPKYCWCMVWRAEGAEARLADNAHRKAAMQRRVKQGTPVGLLGYLGDEPVAWCSLAPRDTYRKGLGGLNPEDEAPERVWSLACFFVTRAARGQGIAQRLIKAAIAHARKRGASVVEAYPVDPSSPSYRFMGFVETFEQLGFQEVGREGSRRHVYRYELSA
ncbi:GNAT family N-acetyltransferase [Myxococcus qinghaiensis]|uniref:GNAT family N-acetyltransferase n=1 Tax=Myxococcus qinghaiensis TaxID=2906758 RepID=UPI0020A7C2C4|nr:GNAT family N-acetyltransferase [Myxococcus qinghaiensis]MCP3169698.1 GNAT family N-acetyltransferase [Myxococcus qinghaiensis]